MTNLSSKTAVTLAGGGEMQLERNRRLKSSDNAVYGGC